MDYTKHFSNSLSLKGLAALKYLSKHNRHYQNLQLNENLFNLVESTDQRLLGNFNGELFLKVNQGPNKSAGLDVFTFNRLPLGETKFETEAVGLTSTSNHVSFDMVETSADVTETVAKIVNSTKGSVDLESLLFYNLYPSGENGMNVNESEFTNNIKSRILHRKQISLLARMDFFQFDFIEKRRLQWQQLKVLKEKYENEHITKKDLIEKSKYDKKLILNEDMTTPLQSQIRGGANYFSSVRCNLRQLIKELGNPNLFLTFSPNERNNPDLEDYIQEFQDTFDNRDESLPLHIKAPVLSTLYNFEKLRGMLRHAEQNGIDGCPVLDSFARFEFQESKTPHMHLIHPTESMQQLLNMITCQIPDAKENPIGNAVVRRYQAHTS